MNTEENKPRLRSQKKAVKSSNTTGEQKNKKKKKNKRKINPLVFTLMFISIAIITLIIGSLIGYGVLGEENPLEVFNVETWMHMYNLIFG